MAVRKYLSKEEACREFSYGGRNLIFINSNQSPIHSLTAPQNTISVILESEHSIYDACSPTNGTIYFVRSGNQKVPIKTDMYPFHYEGENLTEILDSEYKKSKNIKGHWGLPDIVKQQSPNWFNKKVREVSKRLESGNTTKEGNPR